MRIQISGLRAARYGLAALALSIGLLPMASGTARAAAVPSLQAVGMPASGLVVTAFVRKGPYFAGEALVVKLTLRNNTKKTLQVTQPGLCRFSAVLLLPGGKTAGSPLPQPPSCAGSSVYSTLKPGGSLNGSALVAIPSLTGSAGKGIAVRLRATALLSTTGVALINPAVQSAPVIIPYVVRGKPGPAKPEQTLQISVVRVKQGFQIQAMDGKKNKVPGARGWYVLSARDGQLAWGVAAPNTTICGTGCLPAHGKGPYQLQVVMAQDGYTVAHATMAYK